MQRNTKRNNPRYGHLPITDEDICVAYANQITRTVNAEQALPGIEHCLFLVLHAGKHRCFSRASAPKSWIANGGDADIYPTLAAIFQECVKTRFRLIDDPRCATLYAFTRAFERRLIEDRFDDRRVAQTILFAAHPEGYGTMVCLKGVDWAAKHVAEQLLVDLKDCSYDYANSTH